MRVSGWIPCVFAYKFFLTDIIHYNGYGHLWFLLYLFLCFPQLMSSLASLLEEGLFAEESGCLPHKGNRVLIPFGLIVLFGIVFAPIFSATAHISSSPTGQMMLSTWACFSLAMSLRRMSEFRSVFVHTVGYQSYWFYSRSRDCSMWTFKVKVFYVDSIFQTIVWVISKGIYESAAIVLLINIGSKQWNVDGALRYLSKASFQSIFYIFCRSRFSLILIRTSLPGFLEIFIDCASLLHYRIHSLRMLEAYQDFLDRKNNNALESTNV